jgi:hypothetical protein
LPSSSAPAARSRATTVASRGGVMPSSAGEPAVVAMRSALAMLSLISTGKPCSGPRSRPAARSASSRMASASASGLSSSTLARCGPAASSRLMRSL